MREQSRRSILGSIGLITTTGVIGSASGVGKALSQTESSPTVSETDWPTHRGGHNRSGSAVEEAAPNGEYGTLAWYRDGIRGSISREPIVANGSIYVTSHTSDAIGTEGVTSFDAETGDVQWTRKPPWNSEGERRVGSTSGTPTVGGGRLYISSSGDDYKNRLGGYFALDTETGETVWKREPFEDGGGGSFYYDGTVFISGIALDSETGEEVWSSNGNHFLGITNGLVYGLSDGELVARNPTDGTVEQSTTLEVQPSRGAALIEGEMYFEQSNEESNEIVSLSLDDGTVQWRWTATPEGEEPLANISKPAVRGGTVYAHVSNVNQEEYARGVQSTVYALDAENGQAQWSFDTSTVLRGNPTVAGDTMYVGGHALPLREHEAVATVFRWPTIHALATDDGSERWSVLCREGGNPEGSTWTARTPIVANGRVYAGGFDKNDTMDGTVGLFSVEPNDTAPSSWNQPISSDAPVARITSDSETQNLDSGSTVTLDGSSSIGDVQTYEWRLGEGGSFDRTGPTTDVTMNFCGSLEVTLRVTSPDGDATTAFVTLSTGE